MSSVEIVRANATHEDDIKEMLGLFFDEDVASIPYLNTSKNIEAYYSQYILPCIIRDDPVLIAIKDGEAVGFNCLTTQLNQEYDLKYKTICGILTFVKEAYRREGIAMSFKEQLFDWVLEAGYEIAVGEWIDINIASHAHTKSAIKKFKAETKTQSTQYVIKLQ